MRHPEAGMARFPVSSVQHWSGHGWQECEPPAKPPRPERQAPKKDRPRAPRPIKTPPPEAVKSTPVDATQDEPKKTSTKSQKAPSGRKEAE